MRRFVDFVEAEGAEFVTTDLAVRWALQSVGVQRATHARRLEIVRGFAAWLQATDTRTQVPPQRLLPAGPRRPAPHIYTDREIADLIAAAGRLRSMSGLRPATFRTLLGLLAATGLRPGEALALDHRDVDLVGGALDPWSGAPKRIRKEHSASLIYRLRAEGTGLPMRLKVEINTTEAFSIQGHVLRSCDVASRWFSGTASVRTFPIEELLGTKLRALYQRRKSRDLFDLWFASARVAVDPDGVVSCFRQYMAHGGHQATRAQFEANLHAKLHDPLFAADLTPLLAPGVGWDIEAAGRYVRDELLSRLPGDPWKGAEPS